MITREWQRNLLEQGLEWRLVAAGCPCSLEIALATADRPYQPLQEWVRSGFGTGLMLRTAQAEHVAAGHSLAETSRLTLGREDIRFVLSTLARFELEMSEVDGLYAGVA